MIDEPLLRVAPLRRRFAVDPRAIRATLATVRNWAAAGDFPPDVSDRLELALAETLNNIAEHAYAGHGGPVILSLRLRRTGIACLLCDRGGALPGGTWRVAHPSGPGAALPADTETGDPAEGGYGWFLIRSLATDLHYRRWNGVNALRFCVPCAPPDSRA